MAPAAELEDEDEEPANTRSVGPVAELEDKDSAELLSPANAERSMTAHSSTQHGKLTYTILRMRK